MTKTRDTIINLLLGTERDGMRSMIDWLVEEGFFEAPASTKFHGSHPGGLAEHSLAVLHHLCHRTAGLKIDSDTSRGAKPLPITEDTFIIAALLHDVCKVGAYLGTEAPYRWNKQQPKGHATLSIARIETCIALAPLEEMMIRYHMGIYGLEEYYTKGSWDYDKNVEYQLRSKGKKKKNPTPEEKTADQQARYGKSLRNAWYHNPVVKIMYFCDELATLEEKAKL